MKIESPAEDKIIVELSEKDMQELDITYEEMDYSALETRRVIRCVLDAAGRALGRELDLTRRMMIEAMPESGGGCILSFTMLEKRSVYRLGTSVLKKHSEYLMCGFDSAAELMECFKVFPSVSSYPESSLYESGGRYRLLMKCNEEAPALRRHFEEYCRELSFEKRDYEFTREHWKAIKENSAVQSLAKFS